MKKQKDLSVGEDIMLKLITENVAELDFGLTDTESKLGWNVI